MIQEPNHNKKKRFQISIIYFVAFLLVIVLINILMGSPSQEVPYSKFVEMGQNGQIQSVYIDDTKVFFKGFEQEGVFGKSSQPVYYTNLFGDEQTLLKQVQDWGIEEYGDIVQETGVIGNILFNWILPIAVVSGIWMLIMRLLGRKMGNPMTIGKNNEKIYAEKETGVTFKDVAGQDEAKESLKEIIDFMQNQDKYEKIGAKMPKGMLLVGPPGTGKTLLAKAVAGEAKVPFFSISGSEFVQMFVGVGASRVRDLFTQAQKKAPCIVFIDEIDAIGKSRATQGPSNDEREQTLNQLLTSMDGFESNKGVVILAATNRPEVLDQALLRPGRFDRRIVVDKPDLIGREAILNVHAATVELDKNVDMREVAKITSGAAGADLANIINEGALLAIKRSHKKVMQQDLLEAVEINIAGAVKKDRILSDQEKKVVAYHEIGHALVAAKLDKTDPVHKITIIPRTKGALGYTMQLPSEEKFLTTKEEMMNQIAIMLAGRSAEEEIFSQLSTGASNDVQRATETARRMVTMYGMGDEFDMMALESIESQYIDGRPLAIASDETMTKADQEVLAIIKTQHMLARKVLKENIHALHRCSEYLLEHETITGEEFMRIVTI